MLIPVTQVAGINVLDWIDIFEGCYTKTQAGPVQWAWPNGECYLYQDEVTVQMFRLIKNNINEANR